MPGVDQLVQLGQLVGVGLQAEEAVPYAMGDGGILGGRAEHSDQYAPRLEDAPRALLCLAALGIDHHIYVANRRFKTRGRVVDRLVDAQTSQERQIVSR